MRVRDAVHVAPKHVGAQHEVVQQVDQQHDHGDRLRHDVLAVDRTLDLLLFLQLRERRGFLPPARHARVAERVVVAEEAGHALAHAVAAGAWGGSGQHDV